MATIMLDRVVTPYEVAILLHAVKLARMSVNRKYSDNYVDGVNYLAFAAQFAELEMSNAEADEIAAMGRRYGFASRDQQASDSIIVAESE